MQKKLLEDFSQYWPDVYNDGKEIIVKNVAGRAMLEAKRYIFKMYGKNIPDGEKILEDYFANFNRSDDNVVSLSNFYLLRTIKEILRNPGSLFATYEKQKDLKAFWAYDPKYEYRYTANQEENLETIAYDIFHNFVDENGEKFKKEKLFNLGVEERDKLEKYLMNWMRDVYKGVFGKLTSKYIKGIINSVTMLQKLGVLDSLVEKNNRDREKMGIDVLKFELKSDCGIDRYSLEDLKNEEVLKKIPFEKLALMHSYYFNRLKKITNILGMGLFICNKVNDFSLASSDEIDSEKLIRAYSQYAALNSIYKASMPIIYSNKKDYQMEGIYSGNMYIGVSVNKIYESLISPYEKPYSLYSEGDGELSKDFFDYISTQVIDYLQKDFAMETLLLIAMEKFNSINWGYIPEERKGENSIVQGKKNILLGFDVSGFNMPVRLHMPIEKIRNFFGNFDKSYEIPNYIGNEDMEVWNRNMGAAILMPLSSRHRKQLITIVKKMKSDYPYYNFVRHIECMQYDNNLFRIQKWKDPNGRKGERSYTNVITGEVRIPCREKK